MKHMVETDNGKMVELKSCPHCGSMATIIRGCGEE